MILHTQIKKPIEHKLGMYQCFKIAKHVQEDEKQIELHEIYEPKTSFTHELKDEIKQTTPVIAQKREDDDNLDDLDIPPPINIRKRSMSKKFSLKDIVHSMIEK